ncbi:RBBP9/YdeN family alpha/beta hydrolase [Variovorax sp. VNK109]|jgi:predicted alpha/beta hydrolase family esterase|uniref:RBBP9/YdeN family alpha/beta hydrolase n=1 Tax=Variovorax sp. VNK109 TaxID=3400919 RepID=UPI003C09D594
MKPSNVLILPGWQNSGPTHWQSLWEVKHGFRRVEQHDWMRPLRGDWIARLEEVVLSCDEPAVLVAHSLGCIQAAAWAAHSKNTARVKAALLVAVPDVEREDLREVLPGWSPIARGKLPFHAEIVASTDDPYGGLDKAGLLAAAWGADLVSIGPRGHINSGSGLADWPEGFAMLDALMQR